MRLAAGTSGEAATNETVKAKRDDDPRGRVRCGVVMCLLTFRSAVARSWWWCAGRLAIPCWTVAPASSPARAQVSYAADGGARAGIGALRHLSLQSYAGILHQGLSVRDSYERTLRVTGASIIFTGVTLAIGVATWVFSPLKFQADIGNLMLTFMSW